LEELRYEIDKLRSDIPYLLQDDLQNTRDMLPREGRLSEIVLSHFSTEIFAHSSVTLTISPFDVEEEGAFYNGPYWIVSEQSMSQLHAGIYNKDNIMIGVIENQFPEVFINDYIFTVLSLISVICGKTNSIDEMPLMHSRFVIGEATITKIPYGQKILFKIPATINVLARG